MKYIFHPPLQFYEIMMQGIPNFLPRGHSIRVHLPELTPAQTKCEYCLYVRKHGCYFRQCPYTEEKVMTGTATLRQIMTETFASVPYPPFRRRVEAYLRESEEHPMNYFDRHHKTAFTSVTEHLNRNNYELLATVYLLTAEYQLWKKSRFYVDFNTIRFDQIHLTSVSERAYTLYACAKDLYTGTKHITVTDLCDEQLISPKLFGVICNAMAIRRFGLNALHWEKEEQRDDPEEGET